MGVKIKKRQYSLKFFFIKFILSLIIGAGVSIALPLVLATLASNMGYITVANYNEIQAEKTAKILETEKNPDYKNIPAGIKYLIISKEFDILNTNMSNGEQKDALRYANGKFEKTASGKQFILVTRDKEFCILQYYIGSHFTNIWLDIHMPSPDILINAGMILNCLFVFSIMVFLFAKELRKELKPVMDATTKIEEQELEFNISSSRIIEFNDILKSIYNMKNSLKKSLKTQWNIECQQKEQISALAHDLKTPLTIIAGNADLLSETNINQEQEEYINHILESSKRMENYIAILIDLSKNTGEIPINRESISIGKFIDSIKGQMQSVVAMKKMNLIIAIMDESFRIEIDTVLMERAIINVLSNAVDHSPTHGEIIFNVTKDKGKCKISIIDSGPGFTPAALKYGLERFFMDDKSRNYQHHYGMGLYITNSIVTQHGGKVELKNKRGAEVDIII